MAVRFSGQELLHRPRAALTDEYLSAPNIAHASLSVSPPPSRASGAQSAGSAPHTASSGPSPGQRAGGDIPPRYNLLLCLARAHVPWPRFAFGSCPPSSPIAGCCGPRHGLSLLQFPRCSPSPFHHCLRQGRASCSMPILLLHKLQARAGWEARIPFREKRKPEVWKLVFIIILKRERTVDDYKPEREPLALLSPAARGRGHAHCRRVRALWPVLCLQQTQDPGQISNHSWALSRELLLWTP